MQALIIDKEGKIRYIPNLPEKKNFGRPNDFIYALDQSVDSAIMVKNQEYAKVLIESKHSSLIIDAAIYLGIPYEFPDLKVRIENIEHGGHPDVDFGLGYTEQIAIIEEEKGEEGEDEMWINIHKEISISVIEAINTGRSLPRKESIEALKQQYKITKR